MKTSALCVGFLLFFATGISHASTSVDACGPTVTVAGQVEWRGPSWPELKRLGVRKSAEDEAVQNCFARGLSDCVAISSVITTCVGDGVSNGFCSARALARGRK